MRCKPDSVLARLDTEMCVETLWLYALADVCNLTTLREQISSKALWNKRYSVDAFVGNPQGGLNLAVIAAFLGSCSLMNYVLKEISDADAGNFMHFSVTFDIQQIYYNNEEIEVTPLTLALLGNNVELVNKLLPLTLSTIDPAEEEKSRFLVPLLLFYIKHQNQSKLAECLNEFDEFDGGMLVASLGVYPEYLGMDTLSKRYEELRINEDYDKTPLRIRYNILNVAIDCEWKAGADLLLSTATQHIHKGDKEILYHTIHRDNLPVLEELVARGISLFIKYPIPESDHLEYPLITAIRVSGIYEGISDFIIKKIGVKAAIQQIDDRQKNFIGDEQDVIKALSEYRDELEGSSKTEIVEDVTQPLSSGILSFFSTERSSQTTSVPSSSSPAP